MDSTDSLDFKDIQWFSVSDYLVATALDPEPVIPSIGQTGVPAAH